MVRSHARRSGISSVDDLESESVSTERIGIREYQKEATHTLTQLDDGSYRLLDDTGEVLDSVSADGDVTALLDYLATNIPMTGANVYVDEGTYSLQTAPNDFSQDSIQITGAGRSTVFELKGAFPAFSFRRAGEAIEDGPILGDLTIDAQGNHSRGIYLDTCRDWELYGLKLANFTAAPQDGPIFGRPGEGSQNLDGGRIAYCRSVNSPRMLYMRDGAAGVPADIKLENLSASSPTKWAFRFKDANRVVVDGIYAGSPMDFDGCLLLEHLGSAENNVSHTIKRVEAEDFSTASDAVAVSVFADSTMPANHDVQNVRIERPRKSPPNSGKAVFLSSTGGPITGTVIDGTYVQPAASNYITVNNAEVTDTHIHGVDDSWINDNGTRTRINGSLGARTSDPAKADLSHDDKWYRTDQTPAQLRRYDEESNTIRHFAQDGSS